MPSQVSGPIAPVVGRPSSDWMTDTEDSVASPKMPSYRDSGHLGIAAGDDVDELLRLPHGFAAHPLNEKGFRQADELLEPFLFGLGEQHGLVGGKQGNTTSLDPPHR